MLAENMGRANFGNKMMRKKGLPGRVLLGNKIHFSWDVYPLQMTDISALKFGEEVGADIPAFYRGTFSADEAYDTFLRTDNFKRALCCLTALISADTGKQGRKKRFMCRARLLKRAKTRLLFLKATD